MNYLSHKKLSRAARLASVATIAILIHRPLVAAPLGETIVTGEVTVDRSGDNLATTVNQTSDRAVIQWNSFNLAANEQVDFIVPTVTSATLNQINDSSASTISGTITSNGTVYFVNPNGLVFDATSRVTANGFTAFTGAIDAMDFINNPLSQLSLRPRGEGQVSLNGSITIPMIVGYDHPNLIQAVGESVMVGGSLEVPSGTVALDSTSLTHIGKAAVISVGLANNGEGGNLRLSSDTEVKVQDSDSENHASLTSLRGTISLTAPTVTVGGNLTATRGDISLNSTTSTSLTSKARLSANLNEWGAMGIIDLRSDGAITIAALGQATSTRGQIKLSGQTITVGGTLTAVIADISLASSQSTEITADGIVSADRNPSEDGSSNFNLITLASGGTLTVAGRVTAVGNTIHPKGGTIILRARSGLNLTGTVTTRAAAGVAGNLTLAAPMIEIGSGDIEGITYLLASRVNEVAANNNLILDTTSVELTGLDDPLSRLGSILVSEATTVRKNLTLRANKIIVNAALTAGNDLTLHQLGSSDSDGIAISGAALTAGGNLNLLQNGTVADGKSGILLLGDGISLTSGGGIQRILIQGRSPTALQLQDGQQFALSGGRLRLELGSGTITSNGGILKVSGLEVIYNGALSGNSATLAIGSGSLTRLIDHHGLTAPLIIGDGYDTTALLNSDGMGFTAAASNDPTIQVFSKGGLTVTSRGGIESVNSLGLLYGGTVEIKGVKTGAAKNLFVIEAAGIAVTAASLFDHSLILSATGAGIASSVGNSGIWIKSDLVVGSLEKLNSILSLRQSGVVAGDGIFVDSAKILVTGSLVVEQSQSFEGNGFTLNNSTLILNRDFTIDQNAGYGGDGVYIKNLTLTTGGALRFNLQFDQMDGFGNGGQGIEINDSNLTVGTAIDIVHRGSVGGNGLYLSDSKFKSGESVTLSHDGYSPGDGIYMREIDINSGADLSILQNGTVGDGASGIRFVAIDPRTNMEARGIKLYGGGSARNWITLSSRAAVGLTLDRYNSFELNSAKVRIDLGSGKFTSNLPSKPIISSPNAPPPITTYDLYAVGLAVYFTGATSGHQARLRLGDGTFTYVTDHRDRSETTVLDINVSGGNATIGWDQGLVYINSTLDTRLIDSNDEISYTYVNSTGLKIKTYGGINYINGNGVVYGGLVEITGLNAASPAGNLNYIEGAAIRVRGSASNFKTSVNLISNGTWTGAVAATAGIEVTTNLSAGPASQNYSSLNLIQKGTVVGDGISISGMTLTPANQNQTNVIYLLQSGIVSGKGIVVDNSTITTPGYLSLKQTGLAATGIMVSNSNLISENSLSISVYGAVSQTGIKIMNSNLTSKSFTDIGMNGNSGGSGLVLSDSEVLAETNITLFHNGRVGEYGYGIEFASTKAQGEGIGKGSGVLLQSGLENSTIGLRSNAPSALGLSGHDNFILTNGAVAMNLGQGRVESFNVAPSLGTGAKLAIQARNLQVSLIAANSGNSVRIIIDKGKFTKTYDRAVFTDDLLIDDKITAETLGGSAPVWDGDDSHHSAGGLTVETQSGGVWQGFGIFYGGNVQFNGVTTGIGRDLSFLRANAIIVRKSNRLNQQLTLISTGTITLSDGTTKSSVGILFDGDLSTGSRGDGTSSLSLTALGTSGTSGTGAIDIRNAKLVIGGDLTIKQIQNATNTGTTIYASTIETGGDFSIDGSGYAYRIGINLDNNTIKVKGNLSFKQANYQSTNGIAIGGNNITVGGNILLSKSGYTDYNAIAIAASQFTAGGNIIFTSKNTTEFSGIYSESVSYSAKGDIDFEVAGNSGRAPIFIHSNSFSSGRDLTLSQQESSTSDTLGIYIIDSHLRAAASINLLQLGKVNETAFPQVGIGLLDSSGSGGVSLSGQNRNLSWINFKATAKLGVGVVGANALSFMDAKVRIDLAGIWLSDASLPTINSVKAMGLDIFYNSANSISFRDNGKNEVRDNLVQFDIGDGSFTKIIDRRGFASDQVLESFQRLELPNFSGVRVTNSPNNPRTRNIGLVYTVGVTLGAMPLDSFGFPITYIEGKTIIVTNGNSSGFGQLNLVTNGGKVTLGGAVSFKDSLSIFTRGGDLELTRDISTSGGLVAINLGSGSYNNELNGLARSVWQIGTASNRNPLYLYASDWKGSSNDGAVIFGQVSQMKLFGPISGSVTSSADTGLAKVGFYSDNLRARHYFTTVVFSADAGSDFALAQSELSEMDSDAILHPLDDLTKTPEIMTTVTEGLSLDEASGNLVWKTAKSFIADNGLALPNSLGFFAVRAAALPGVFYPRDTTITFAGNNRISEPIDWSAQSRIVAVTLLDDSSIRGKLILPSDDPSFELTVGQWVTLPSIESSGTIRLRLNGDLTQSARTSFNANIVMVNQASYSLRLTSGLNQIGSISGATRGGSVTVTSIRTLDLSGLDSGGGSIFVRSEGSIRGENMVTGAIEFMARGGVSLSGSFAAARGFGQSVRIINSSASSVVGNVASDGAIELGGSGASLLVGNLSSNGGAIEITQPIMVVDVAEIVTHDGVIAIAKTIAAINRANMNSLILRAGDKGRIDLGGNGDSIRRLGWVSLSPEPETIRP